MPFLLQVTGGRLEGLQSLERSSDAIVSYSEESGSPVFSIATSLSLTDLVMRSMAHGEVRYSLLAPEPFT